MRRLVLIVVTALMVLASPALALAANGPWQSVNLTLINGQDGQPVLLVAGQLAESTSLPAKLTLAVPPGATIAWAGEILGGDPSKDPTVQYTVKAGKDYDLLSFTLTKSRTGQVELPLPSAVSSTGGEIQTTIDWVAPFDIPSSTLAIALPGGAKVTSGTADATTEQDGTTSFFKRTATKISAGDRLKLTVAYTGGTTSGATGTSSAPSPATAGATPSGGASPLLIISVLGLLVSLTFALMKWVSPKSEASDDVDGEEPDGTGHARPQVADDVEPVEADTAEPDHDCGPSCTCGANDSAPPAKKRTPSTKSGSGTARPSAAKKKRAE